MKASKTYLAFVLGSAMVGGFVLPGCETSPPTQAQRDTLKDDSDAAINDMKRTDPTLGNALNNSVGYVIFPTVGKGAVGLGGGWGRGEVYNNGKFIGFADITMGTAGVSVGGQTYSELIVFQTQDALNKFINNKFEPEASASAVALRAGASAEAKYSNGVAMFTHAVGGLMVDASVGGQNFTFTAKNK